MKTAILLSILLNVTAIACAAMAVTPMTSTAGYV